MNHNLNYDKKYNSLFDVYIPICDFIKQVKEVEGCSTFNINRTVMGADGKVRLVDLSDSVSGRNVFTIPYPYTEPLAQDLYLAAKENEADIPDQVVNSWMGGILKRSQSIINNSLTFNALNKMDSQPNTGYIIHKTSGHIVIYDPTEQDLDLEFVSINHYAIRLLNKSDMSNVSKEYKYKAVTLYNYYYRWKHADGKVDCVPGPSNSIAAQLRLDDLNDMFLYIHERIIAHDRIIIAI